MAKEEERFIITVRQPEHEPLDPEVVAVFEDVIGKLKQKRGVEQPTKSQLALEDMLAAGKEGITLHDLAHIWRGVDDPKRRATRLLGHLNSDHLNPRGVHILGELRYHPRRVGSEN